MRAAPAPLYLAAALAAVLALGEAACGGGKSSNQDAAAQDDVAVPQHDAALHQDTGADDAQVQRDAPPANADSGQSLVQCGTNVCSLAAGEWCCETSVPSCVPMNTCAGYATMRCDGPEDCFMAGSPVCCANTMSGNVLCVPDGQCAGTGYFRVCRADDECGNGEKCCGYAAVKYTTFQYCLASASCVDTSPAAGVACGNSTCTSPDVCCMDWSAGSCGASGSCTGQLELTCDGPEDCGQNEFCCGNIGWDVTVTGGTSCVTSCTVTGNVGGIVCHSDADCPNGKVCRQKGYAGYGLRLCL